MPFDEIDFNEKNEGSDVQDVFGFDVEEEENESARLISMHDFSEFGDDSIDGGSYTPLE